MGDTIARAVRTVPLPFEKTILLTRGLLSSAGFHIVEEFDMSKEPYFDVGVERRICVVLLVDIPMLMFEAIALDCAAAVLLPIHVAVSGGRASSCVEWIPVAATGLRLPASAQSPVEQMYLRLKDALSALPCAQTAIPGGAPGSTHASEPV